MKKVTFLLLIISLSVVGQEAIDIPNLTPLSPNAAAIAKYGEIPIGHFTGTPNISIPIYTVNSGELSVPISISYHAGGNRVETIASWVGMGWSLNTIPTISRSVRGIPDEQGGGFFYGYMGKTVRQLMQEEGEHYELFRADLYGGDADSEPDIFHYSLPDETGKFFFDQESETFITVPKSNIIITREGHNFMLKTQNGIEYVLDVKETTASQGTSSQTTSSWKASKMISASKKDTIRFNYVSEDQRYWTKTLATKYQFLRGVVNGSPPVDRSINTLNIISAKVLNSIEFRHGRIDFNRSTSEREDLKGGYSLSKIAVHGEHDEPISQFNFTYDYLRGSSCSPNDEDYVNNWMLLEKLENVSLDSVERLSHQFFYDRENIPPCRKSPAQDYWGYYNGKLSNRNLIPTTYVPNSNPPQQIAGADREVNPTKSQFGILNKIIYPTGGYTELEYENHDVVAGDVPVQYVDEAVFLEGEGEGTPSTDYYEATFTINNLPDLILNNNNPNGGGNVKVEIGFPGCDLSNGADQCAIFRLIGLSPENANISYTLHMNRDFYLPNGAYKISAEFDQDPPQYQEFYFTVTWKKRLDTNESPLRYAGGLRVKEIRNYPNSLSRTRPIVKRYHYVTDYNSNESSGDIFGEAGTNFADIIEVQNGDIAVGGSFSSLFLRLRSISTMQQISHSGSFVGYKTVIEETDEPDKTGYTIRTYSHVRDVPYGIFPHPPAQSNELYRGQLQSEVHYTKRGDVFEKTENRVLEYTSIPYHTASEFIPVRSYAAKWGNNVIRTDASPWEYAQNLTEYEIESGWTNIAKETVTRFFESDSVTSVTNYHYDNPAHLLLTRTDKTNSEGGISKTSMIYPQDQQNPSEAEQQLIEMNKLTIPVEIKNWEVSFDGLENLLSTQHTQYKDWGDGIILPEKVSVSKGTETIEDRLIYHDYDAQGNLLEVSRKNGVHISYIWGYGGTYPVAKIHNATQIQIAALNLDATIINAPNSDAALRTELNKLYIGLPDAEVTLYTYAPLVGVTSVTDPNGLTLFYEYDTFNRLRLVKDYDGNILSKHEYHYRSQ